MTATPARDRLHPAPCARLVRPIALLLALLAGCAAGPQPPVRAPAATGATWMPAVTRAAAATAAPAISLTTSDGAGLRLVELRARAWVDAPLALTELHLTFENPHARTLEGNFAIELPPRSAVSRFAMKIDERWQEGEVVERQAARRIFEDALHARQDPALLEHDAGQRFRARVFPIAARGRKQLIVTYSQELAGSHADYRLPLGGLPDLDALDVRVLAPDPRDAGAVIELYRARDAADARALTLREQAGPQDVALRSGDLALARITVGGPEAPAGERPRVITVLFDTSASQAARFPQRVTRLAALVERLGAVYGASQPLRVWCFDQEAVEVFRGAAGEFSRRHTDEIVRRRALGATDLAGALAAIGVDAAPGERVVIVGDGVSTAGADDGGALRAAARDLRAAGVARIDAIAGGGARDLATLTQLVAADAGARAGVVVDGALAVADIVEKLRRPTYTAVHVTVPGSRWTWPERLDGVQPGDTVLVYADLPADRPLHVELDGGLTSPKLTTRAALRPLLERAWVGARIERLLALRGALPEGDEDMRRALRDQVVQLSRKHRVLGPFTGLLVLESEADYRRHGIRRDALAQILTVGDDGPRLLHRDGARLYVPGGEAQAPVDASGEADDGPPEPDDRCPGVPETFNGYQDEDGCPDEIPTQLARFTGSIRGIGFAGESAKIGRRSAPVLDRAIAVMREFSTIELEISGHRTRAERSDVGLLRAAAVRDYFIARGIEPARLTIRDAGADEPVDSEATAAGRAKNRRIDFTIQVGRMSEPPAPAEKPAEAPAHTGEFAEVMAVLAHDRRAALVLASAWCDREPGDVLALIALGQALAAAGDRRAAARAYGSLIDLHPSRADLRRHAGQRLATLGEPGLTLAIDSYQKAASQRPDHATGHRLHAYALARAGRAAGAFNTIVAGLRAGSSRPRAGVDEVMRADAAVLAAVLLARAPERRAEVVATLQAWGVTLPRGPSTSFVLSWETDANDVDLHVLDGAGARASYVRHALPSGGSLVADVTNGYGPEMFTIAGAPRGYPYTLEAHYFGQGPMGYGMGTLQVIEHDGRGRLRIDERPFVIMNAGARVPLGRVERP